MTIYNYGKYTGSPGQPPGTNDPALVQMFTDMSGAPGGAGGLAFISQDAYPVIAGIINSSTQPPFFVPPNSVIVGSGGGGPGISGLSDFFHFQISPATGATVPSCFLYATDGHSFGGQYFIGLAFQWQTTSYIDTCIYAGTWNCRAVRCTFTDCPNAFYANGEASGLEQCTIDYTKGQPDHAVAVYLQGVQSHVVGPGVFEQTSVNKSGPKFCSAIALGGGAGMGVVENAIISNMHLSDWSYAIDYSKNPGVKSTHTSNVLAQSYITSVYMTPPAQNNNQIYGEKYVSCNFEKSHDSMDGSAIVFIDTGASGGNNTINDIEFLNCTVFSDTQYPQTNQYCYQITSGSNIRIIGGTVSNAGSAGAGTAGIAITQPSNPAITGPGRITILGVDLSQNYPNATYVHSQEYALYVAVTPADVITVDDCKMTGYPHSPGPVKVTGTINTTYPYLYIRNCEGYNDLNTPIAPTAPGSGGACAATASSITGGINYYGPSLVIFTNGSGSTVTFTVNGVSSTVPKSAFIVCYLASPYDVIAITGGTLAAFSWLGK